MQTTKIERKQDRRVLNYVAKRKEMDAYNGFVKSRNDIYPAICRAVRSPPQNSAEAKKLDGDQLSVKARLVRID